MSCRSLYVLATLFTSTLGVIPVHAQSTSFDVENGQYNNCTAATNNYSYCLNLPPKYGEKHSWPLMVFLGGSGTKGDASEAKYLATYESLGMSKS